VRVGPGDLDASHEVAVKKVWVEAVLSRLPPILQWHGDGDAVWRWHLGFWLRVEL
jgi:hypothetical protein